MEEAEYDEDFEEEEYVFEPEGAAIVRPVRRGPYYCSDVYFDDDLVHTSKSIWRSIALIRAYDWLHEYEEGLREIDNLLK